MSIHDIETQLEALSRNDKERIFGHLAQELFQHWPGIEKTPGVQGGDACIVRTHIPVWTLDAYRRLGWNEGQLLTNFPTLRSDDLVYVWLYVDAHTDEIEQALQEQEQV